MTQTPGYKRRIILIGQTSAGKTTLCQYLAREEQIYRKTQTVQIFSDWMIDTPGEYIERRNLYGALTVSASDADCLVLVQDATAEGTVFPPAYAGIFAKPAAGVVSKADIASAEQIDRAGHYLRLAGAERIFITSSKTGQGIAGFMAWLSALPVPEETEA